MDVDKKSRYRVTNSLALKLFWQTDTEILFNFEQPFTKNCVALKYEKHCGGSRGYNLFVTAKEAFH